MESVHVCLKRSDKETHDRLTEWERERCLTHKSLLRPEWSRLQALSILMMVTVRVCVCVRVFVCVSMWAGEGRSVPSVSHSSHWDTNYRTLHFAPPHSSLAWLHTHTLTHWDAAAVRDCWDLFYFFLLPFSLCVLSFFSLLPPPFPYQFE